MLVTCERHDMYDLAQYGLPPQGAIYVYPAGTHTGDMGGRKGADELCYKEGYIYHKALKASTVKAFLSVSAMDELRFIVPVELWGYPVYGIDSTMAVTQIADSWNTLITSTPPPVAINVAVGIGGVYWWSGSDSYGSFKVDYACSEWHYSGAASLPYGNCGTNSLAAANQTCDLNHYLLCLAY
jgi:hypothetical protein